MLYNAVQVDLSLFMCPPILVIQKIPSAGIFPGMNYIQATVWEIYVQDVKFICCVVFSWVAAPIKYSYCQIFPKLWYITTK